MADYTPTDGEILTAVVLYRAISSVDAPPPTIDTIATPEETARYLSEYQRWRAEHDAKVRAEALREARDNVRATHFWADGSDNYAGRVRGYLNFEADRIEREAGLK